MSTGKIGTIKWTVTLNKTLILEPLNGSEGTIKETMPSTIQLMTSSAFKKIKHVKTKGILHFSGLTLEDFFRNCEQLETADLSGFETSEVYSLSGIFANCTALKTVNLSSFDTSKVTDMSYVFNNCSSLTNLDLSNFNTSKVIDMNSMFYGCSLLTDLDLSSFDTSNVKKMCHMFTSCSSLKALSLPSFNTSKVEDMNAMFKCCWDIESIDLSSFRTEKVESMSFMFANCVNLKNLVIHGFCINNSTNTYFMFDNCSKLSPFDLTIFRSKFADLIGATNLPTTSPRKYIVSKDTEEKAKNLVPLMFLDCQQGLYSSPNYVMFNGGKEFAEKFYSVLEKIIEGLDFSQERKLLNKLDKYTIDEAIGYKALELYNDGFCPNSKKLSDVVKILNHNKILLHHLFDKNEKAILDCFAEKGGSSEIRAFYAGVPLEDILA